MERVTGIEPALKAWKALVLPLNHTRIARRLLYRNIGVCARNSSMISPRLQSFPHGVRRRWPAPCRRPRRKRVTAYGRQAGRIQSEARFPRDPGAAGLEGRRRRHGRRPALLRRAAPSGEPRPLRPAAGMERHAAQLGRPQRPLVQPPRQAPGRACGGPSARLPRLRRHHSEGRVRRRRRDALGRRDVGALGRRGRGSAQRRAEVRPAGRTAGRRLGARAPGASQRRRRQGRLAPRQGARRKRARRRRHRRLHDERAHWAHDGRDQARFGRAPGEEPLPACRRAAGPACRRASCGHRLALRGEVRRLSHRGLRRGRRGPAHDPQREGLHRPFPAHRRVARAAGRGTRLRARRRGGGRRRGRQDRFPGLAEPPARPAGEAGGLPGLRPAGEGRRRLEGPPADRAEGGARAPFGKRPGQPAVQQAHRGERRGRLPRRMPAGPGRHRRQEGRLAVPRDAQRRLGRSRNATAGRSS